MASTKQGTNVAAAITTFTGEDKYNTAFANEVQGGRHSVATIADRNTIYPLRRTIGMTCYVAETDKTYKLVTNPVTETTSDSDWKLDVPEISDIKIDEDTSLEKKLSDIQTTAVKKYYVFVLDAPQVGANTATEQIVPFIEAELSTMSVCVPSEVKLTKDISINLEVFKSGTWSVVGNIILPVSDTTNQREIDLVVSKVFKGNRLRLNFINIQTGIESLSVQVGLKLTK